MPPLSVAVELLFQTNVCPPPSPAFKAPATTVIVPLLKPDVDAALKPAIFK